MTTKAKTAAQRKKLGVANPERTQDARDRMAFFRYARKHPDEMMKFARFIIEEVSSEEKLLDAGWREVISQVASAESALTA